jgi:hypothetical protein
MLVLSIYFLCTFFLIKKYQKIKAVPAIRPTTSFLAKQNKLASDEAQTGILFLTLASLCGYPDYPIRPQG